MNWNRCLITMLLFAVALVAHGPVMVEYGVRMWTKGHYQFFPVLFLVMGFLFFISPPKYRTLNQKPPSMVAFGLMAVVFAMVLLATGLNSPFLGILSFLLLVGTAIGTLLGAGSLKYMARFLWILVFVVPWPLNFDAKLIVAMQFWASELASTFLDALGFVHFREGVIICTTENRFLTEEACSGVRSLFSAMAAVALWGYSRRYSWVRQFVNWGQAVAWVLVGNAVRIVAVVITADYGMPFFAKGVGHDLLGVLVFGLIMLLVVSTDKILGLAYFDRGYVDRVYADDVEMEEDGGLDSDGFGSGEAASDRLVRPATPAAAKRSLAAAGGFSGAGSVLASVLLIGLFLVVIGLGVRLGLARQPGAGFSLAGVDRLPVPKVTDLPDQIEGWVRQDFYLDHRGEESLFAEYSYIWVYQKADVKVLLSLDCPYRYWHDLSICYRGIGWECQLSHEFGGDTDDGDFSRIVMTKPDGTQGLVMFTAVDRSKAVVEPGIEAGYFAGRSVFGFLAYRLGLGLGLDGGAEEKLSGTRLPITGFQLLSTSGAEFDQDARGELERLFFSARRLWLASERFASGNSDGGVME